MSELDFTTPPKVRRTDPETSRRAWEHIKNKVGTQRWRILQCFQIHTQGLTQDEIATLTGIRVNSVSTRISELLRERPPWLEVVPGVERSGQRVVRRIK